MSIVDDLPSYMKQRQAANIPIGSEHHLGTLEIHKNLSRRTPRCFSMRVIDHRLSLDTGHYCRLDNMSLQSDSLCSWADGLLVGSRFGLAKWFRLFDNSEKPVCFLKTSEGWYNHLHRRLRTIRRHIIPFSLYSYFRYCISSMQGGQGKWES